MNDRLYILIITGAVLLVVSACTSRLERLISDGQQRWESQAITDYKIKVMEASIWHAQTHELIVQEGEIVEATASCNPAPLELGRCNVEAFEAEDYTVEGLFRIARSKSGIAGGKWTEIDFDERYGFPTRIMFDSDNAIDEEVVWRVTDFEILR